VDAAAARGDVAFVAFDHGGHLLALIGMDDKYDFVMPHLVPFGSAPRCGAVEQGNKNTGQKTIPGKPGTANHTLFA
jgi:hypothetical protein